MQEMNRKRFIIGTVLGGAAGVVTGLLTAPKSGQETREEIKAKAAALKEEAENRTKGSGKKQKPINSLKQQAGGVVRKSKKSFKNIAGKS